MSWRPITYVDTDADTDGIKYIDIPALREYKLYSLRATIERSSDITYGSAQYPILDVVTSTGEHGNASERLLARYEQIATLTADTAINYVSFLPVYPHVGDTALDAAYPSAQYWVIQVPELELSSGMRLKVWTSASTGGAYAIFDLEGHFGIRDNKGNRA